ncbi:HNH endonuclease [Halobaculum lipolyticum]|uniref:HNH endonuclease n=1 Tax=Halobaculum lipolyticum TaxID=3032001 RepID=A0ABD5WCC2_9EURY
MAVTPENLFFAPCSRSNKENTFPQFQNTVLDGIDPDAYDEAPDFDHDRISVWGVVSGNKAKWDHMRPGDVVLFYTKQRMYTHAARVVETQHNADLARRIWTTYDEGRRVADLDEPWPYIFYLDRVEQVDIPSPDIHADIGWDTYYPQSFTRVIDRRREKILERYGSIAACLRHHRQDSSVEDPVEADELTSELLESDTAEPDLTADDDEYETQRRRTRSRAFRDAVRTAYDEQCAFCGSRRETIAGTPEVEAAHIYPRSENGVDDLRNGIALCKFHHWAFDSGWATLTPSHEIEIRDKPDREAYDDLQQLDGKSIHSPAQERHTPGAKFIEAHREFHGFDD